MGRPEFFKEERRENSKNWFITLWYCFNLEDFIMKRLGRTFRIRQRNRSEAIDFNNNSVKELYIWMKNKKLQIKKIKPALFNDTGRGLKACEVINSGDVLISIPHNLLITRETVIESYLHAILSKYLQKLSTMELISIFLMCEKCKGLSSYWYPYIRSLPEEYVLPAAFPLEVLNHIPITISLMIRNQIDLLKKYFEKLKKVLQILENHFEEFFGLLTFDNFQWAWLSVNTRCIYMKCTNMSNNLHGSKNNLALAPVLDLLNHSPHVQVKAGFNNETKCYEIIHLNKIEKYHQVFINYGPHTNQTLFLEYGFIVPDNPNDYIFFNWNEIMSAFQYLIKDSHIEEKLHFLQHYNLLSNLGCHREGFTWNLEKSIKILSSSNYSKKRLEEIYFNNYINAEDNITVKRISRQILKNKLKQYSCDFNASTFFPFESKCLKLTQQFCSEERNLLLKNLNML